MLKLYIVRHGRTDWNDKKLMQGRRDIPLNEEGRRQAFELSKTLPSDSYAICFSSPLKRAKETAQIITRNNKQIIDDSLLLERDLGNFEGKKVDHDLIKKMWDFSFDAYGEGVESCRDLFDRAKYFLDKLKKEYEDQSILIVSNGAFIKALHYVIVGYDQNTDFLSFHPKNTTLYFYEIN